MFDLKIGVYINIYLHIQVLRSIGLNLNQNIAIFIVRALRATTAATRWGSIVVKVLSVLVSDCVE